MCTSAKALSAQAEGRGYRMQESLLAPCPPGPHRSLRGPAARHPRLEERLRQQKAIVPTPLWRREVLGLGAAAPTPSEPGREALVQALLWLTAVGFHLTQHPPCVVSMSTLPFSVRVLLILDWDPC